MASIAETPFINKDLLNIRREYIFPAPKPVMDMMVPLMTDRRDEPMIHLLFNIIVTVLPSALLMFSLSFSGWLHLLGVLHVAGLGVCFLPRFILMMHYSSHRFIFTKFGPILNSFSTHFLAPFFGIPCGMYYLHHVVMHHCEGNIFPEDWSSTEMYQRDNLMHFAHYFGKYMTATWFYLPYYACTKKMYLMACQCVLSTVTYFLLLRTMWLYNAWATTYVFLLPALITSFALMFGNWSQHLFLHPEDPESPYLCTYNCMNALDNTWTFNDGYHIVHHVNSRLHWSDMPKNFMENIQKYADKDCIVFDGIGFFDVGLYVFTGQLDKLADHVVQWGFLNGQQRTKEETIAMLKKRMAPIVKDKQKQM